MVEQLQACPICQSQELSHFKTCQDYTVSQEKFDIVNCKSCGFKFTNPRPDEANVGQYYKSDSYISHSNTSKGIMAKLYHAVRKYTLQGKLALINQLANKKGKLLDVGCGTGMFIHCCQEAGWTVKGIEPDSDAGKFAKELNKVQIESQILGSYTEEQFDVITMWHVLEHVHQLNETAQWLNQRLAKDGHLIIAVPNHESKDAHIYQEQWAAYDVPRHLYHFSQKSIKQLMANHGFQLAETRPMKFDSFYVSMLSTKYQTGSINYLKAFFDGLKSNSWATRNQQNYSSLIYVFKKQ